MHDRGLAETFVTFPPRRLRQGEVNLHVAAAETETSRSLGYPGRNISGIAQALVGLRGRDAADDCTLGSGGVAADKPDSGGTTAFDENSLHVMAGLADPTVISHQADERIDEPRAAAARNRHAAGFDREGDHAGHESRRGPIGSESRVENPRRQEPVRGLRPERRPEQPGLADDDVRVGGRETAASKTAIGLHAETQSGGRPELAAQHAEDELRLRTDGRDRLSPRLAVT